MRSKLKLRQLFFVLFFIVISQESKATIVVPRFQPAFTDTCLFLDKKIITTDQVSLSEMVIGDIDGNGLKDIAISVFEADKIAWLRNRGGGMYTEELLDDTMDGASCIAITDREHDGDLDIFGGAYNSGEVRWWNQMEDGTFLHQVLPGTYTGVKDLDIVDIIPVESPLCKEAKEELIITSEESYPLELVFLPCLDQIGNISYLWHEGVGTLTKVRPVNINNSDLLDLVGMAPSEGKLCWWETTDRVPTSRNIITNDFAGINDFATADLDNNGYQDIVAISATLGHIAIWRNSPTGEFNKVLIEEQFLGAQSIAIKDLDGNGFADIVVVSDLLEEVVIWQNSGNLQFNKTVIATGFPGTKILIDDMDGDGDEDLVGASATTGTIYWWEYACFLSQDCTNENLVLNESPIEPATYAGYPLIQSSGKVTSGTSVSFIAGESITLSAGFHAQAGSNFDASIAICKATAATVTQSELLYRTSPLSTSISNPTLSIYPNPSTDKLTISYTLEKDQKTQLYLTDILGHPIKYLRPKVPTLVGQNQEQFLLTDLQAGVYFVILQTEDAYVARKVVVE